MADSNIQTLDTVKPITLDEYQERTAHLKENTTSLLSTIADNQVQAASLATQAASLASEVNAVAEQASLSFTKKTWTDNATSGTPITAAELNRLENAISSLTTAVNNLQDSVSQSLSKTRILFKTVVFSGGGWNLAISASDMSETFGISTSEITSKLVAIVYNGDFNANACNITCSLGQNGLDVQGNTGGKYRVNIYIIMP